MSRSQFYHILGIVDADVFNELFIKWMQSIIGTSLSDNTVAIDGKTICGTDKLTKDGSILHIVSAYASELKLTIGSKHCTSKPLERTAFRELLTTLNLSDTIVVADALHCTKPTLQAILDAGADYLIAVKDNAPSLKQGIKACIDANPTQPAVTKEKNGGRIELRQAYSATDLTLLNCNKQWKGIKTIGVIHREFTKDKKTTNHQHYYISSRYLTAKELLHHVRMEWAVESMHWLLDVHFGEDKTRIFDMNVQNTLNTARKIALNLTQIYKANNCKASASISGIMRSNLFDVDVLEGFVGCVGGFLKTE